MTDSIGRLKSKGKDYINDVQKHVGTQGNLIILHELFSGGDLPEIADYLDSPLNSGIPCDVNLIISMSNYAANTLGQQDISDDIVRSCHRLQEVAKSVPIYVIYGGPPEMWPNVVSCGGQGCFETKAQYIRYLLARSGHIKVKSGKVDFRAFFDTNELDDLGHIRGVARDKAVQWMTKQVMDALDWLALCHTSACAAEHIVQRM